MRVMRRRASFISAPVVFTHFVQDGEGARIGIDRHTERLRHAVGGDVTVGRPDPTGGEDIGAAMPQRIECVDDRALLIADHPHFLEIDADRRQIFRNVADVLVPGGSAAWSVLIQADGDGPRILHWRAFDTAARRASSRPRG